MRAKRTRVWGENTSEHRKPELEKSWVSYPSRVVIVSHAAGNPDIATYCESVDFTRSEHVYSGLVLGRVEKRDNRASLFQEVDFFANNWRSNFEHDIC